MQITVHLQTDIARNMVKRGPPLPATRELLETLSQLGIKLEPLHPDTASPELMSQFWINVPDQPSAEQALSQLLQLKAVEAAYLKPPDAMP